MEPVEDEHQIFLGDTRPTIEDRERSPVDDDVDLPTRLIELACVVDQVRDRTIER
jgi:hypothetical protein